MSKELKLSIGAMSDSLSKQLKEQEFKFKSEDVKHFEKDIESLIRLRIRGYVIDSYYDKVLKKLFKKIEQYVKKMN